jgi:hypothetical protein
VPNQSALFEFRAPSPADRVLRILANTVGSDLSSWEKHEFLPSIKQRRDLTEKQEEVLRKIELRIFSGDDQS